MTMGLKANADGSGAIQVGGSDAITITSGLATTFAAATSVTGDLSFNSGYGSAAVAYGCRAWVNFNGTGTVSRRASGNVSSITDNSTGDYTINFTTALTDTNYAVVGVSSSGGTSATNAWFSVYSPSNNSYATKTTSAVRMITQNLTGGINDAYELNVAIFR